MLNKIFRFAAIAVFCFVFLVMLSLAAMGRRAAAQVAAPMGPSGVSDKAELAFVPPASNRLKFNFNGDWKFIKKDIKGAQEAAFDDASWTTVGLPHTCNDEDSFRDVKDHGRSKFSGKMWYRKHFTVDAAWEGRKLLLEFEGFRNNGYVYINGKLVGEHSNQIGPCGIDITGAVKYGADNVIAVMVDSGMLNKSPRGVVYNWSTPVFYPNFGGLPVNVDLHVTDKLYSTLPLYLNLGTVGTYVYQPKIDIAAKSADVVVEAEIANDYDKPQTLAYEALIIDAAGKTVATAKSEAVTIEAGKKQVIKVSTSMTGVHFWSPEYPYLYRVVGCISVGGKVVDANPITIGIRKAEFSLKNGLTLNGKPIYLKGYAPRTTMEWAVTGIAQNWMLEYDYKLMKENNANFIRPMHVGFRKFQVESADKMGIILACPAGNGEGDDKEGPEGDKSWADRVDVMRDVEIYFRNNPSVLFWEASNSAISLKHMKEMNELKQKWDPHGGRFAGTRGTDKASEEAREYQSPMDVPANSPVMPSWDAEYARAEAPRRVWDKYTPVLTKSGEWVLGGYKAIATGNTVAQYPEDSFWMNSSEDLALNNARKYWDRYKRSTIVLGDAPRPKDGVMVGGAKIIYADSNSHGRTKDVEVARVSGNLDAVRLPKESFHALTVAHCDTPATYILGHWNYEPGTVKPVFVISNTDKVKLTVCDESGKVIKDYGETEWEGSKIKDGKNNRYAFKFDNVAFSPGKIVAVGLNDGKEATRAEKVTVGKPAALKITPILGPGNLRADAADIGMFDVEVVDAQGRRCPLDQARVDFECTGAATFLGGYNSGVNDSIGKTNLMTECGINRVFIRTKREPGAITLTAKREGLTPASVTVTSEAFVNEKGLTTQRPRRYAVELGPEPK